MAGGHCGRPLIVSSVKMKKLRIGILFGGRSAEHEVSLQSAKNIIDAIDREKYEVVLIGIDRRGRWFLNQSERYLLHAEDPRHISLTRGGGGLALMPGRKSGQIMTPTGESIPGKLDVIFPVLHGPYGEDGTVQGLLRLTDLPFVGSDVLGSAVSMDKVVMKSLLRDAGLPQAKFLSYRTFQQAEISYEEIRNRVGEPFFVKPANLGSSVGISKVHNPGELARALEEAFAYDDKIIIEEYIRGREIECAVLGNDDPQVSVTGEVLPAHEFYSYEAKYLDEQGARLQIPADLPAAVVSRVQALAVAAFRVLNCAGMARADFFLRADDDVLINELNTIPGFTKISMYPKLWEASGLSYKKLIDRLIELAIEKHRQRH